MMRSPYLSYFNRPLQTIGTGVIFPPIPDGNTLLQFLGKSYEEDGLYYQEDLTTKRTDAPLAGSYLDMNGTDNYVDTGYQADDTTVAVWKGNFSVSTDGQFIGSIDSTNGRRFFLSISGGQWQLGWGNGIDVVGTADTDEHTYIIYDGKLWILDISTDVSTKEKVKDILDNTTPTLDGGNIWTTPGVSDESFYLGAANLNDSATSYSDFNHYEHHFYEYDGVTISDCALCYYFDEKDGNTAFDASGNENHGTIEGTLTSIHQEDTSIYSYNNEFGKNDGGVVDVELNPESDCSSIGLWSSTGPIFSSDGNLWLANGSGRLQNNSFINDLKGKTIRYVINARRVSGSGILQIGYFDGTWVYPETVPLTNDFATYSFDITIPETATNQALSLIADNVEIDSYSIKQSYPSTVLIPASQANLNEDVIGNTLLNKGKVGYDVQLVSSSVGVFNGTDNYVGTGLTQTGGQPVDVSFSVKLTTPSATNGIFGCGGYSAAVKGFSIRTLSSDWQVSSGDGTTAAAITFTGAPVSSDKQDVRFQWDGTASIATLTVDGVDYPSASVLKPWTGDSSDSITIGAYAEGLVSRTDGDYFNIDYSGKFKYDFGETSGTTVYDKSGNENHGTVNGTTTNFWGTSDEQRPNNLFDGFTQGLLCSTSGTSYKESTQAYGVWEFDICHSTASLTDIFFGLDGSDESTSNGYGISISADERFKVQIKNAGTPTNLLQTATLYITPDVHYRVKIVRNSVTDEFVTGAVGTFAAYIKGGSFGNDYVLVDTTGGVGTNPTTDNTYTTSAYFINSLDAGDQISNLKLNGSQFSLFDFTDGTGVYDKLYIPVDPTGTGEDLTNPGIGETGKGHNGAETNYLQPEVQALIEVESNFDFKPWYGVEKVVNGSFDTDTDWTKGTGWTIEDGKLKVTSAIGTTSQSSVCEDTKTYEVVFTVSNYVAGGIRAICGDLGTGTSRYSNGIFKETITATGGTGTTFFFQALGTTTLDVEIVSVKEVGDTTPAPCPYETISYDYELAGYWFADVLSRSPTKFNWAVYEEQVIEPDLTDVYIFMNSVEALLDVNGEALFDTSGEQLYVLKEDLV